MLYILPGYIHTKAGDTGDANKWSGLTLRVLATLHEALDCAFLALEHADNLAAIRCSKPLYLQGRSILKQLLCMFCPVRWCLALLDCP